MADSPKSDFQIEPTGAMIGRYKILQQIGEGGFGVVYMAEQVEPMQRKVALKIIKAGMDTKEVVARFEAERRAIALMDHPNIARALDAGTTEAGRPYFVMELVRGIPMTEYCDQKQLSTKQRLELFIKVCQAVQHAHQKGVIHRDLKPSNVLVTEHDGEPVPKVIDFGVAKALGQKLTEKTLFTAFNHMIGTPAYMSPEQAALSGIDIDTRADIYSLGVLLYELLTGVTPFDREAFRDAAIDEIRRMIRETEPPKPSTRLRTLGEKLQEVAMRRQSEPAALSRLVRGDLDWIVMKCLEKDRQRRYVTANGLAADLARHLEHEPVTARPASNLYRLQKMVRRRPALAAFVGLLILIGVGAGMTVVYLQQLQTRLRQQLHEVRQLRYFSDMSAAFLDLEQGDTAAAFERLNRYLPAPGEPELRGFEWRYLWAKLRGNYSRSLPKHNQVAGTVRFSPKSQHMVVHTWDNVLTVWDREREQKQFSAPGVTCFGGFTADEAMLVIGRGDGLIQVCDAKTGHTNREVRVRGAMVAFAELGQAAISVSETNGLEVIDVNSGQVQFALPEFTRRWFAFGLGFPGAISPDGKLLALISPDPSPLRPDIEIRLFDLATRQELQRLPVGRHIRSLAFSPDGRVLAAGDGEGKLLLWNLNSPETPPLIRDAHELPLLALAFSPDGLTLATGSSDTNCIRLWNVADGLPKSQSLRGQIGDVWSLAFSTDGKQLASGTRDGPIRIWNIDTDDVGEIIEENVYAHEYGNCVFSPDGRWLAAGCEGHRVKVWDTATLRVRTILTNTTYVVAFSKDGKSLLVSTGNRLPHWEDLENPSTRPVPGYRGDAETLVAVDLTADRRVAALGLRTGEIQIMEIDSGRTVGNSMSPHIGAVRSVALSPAGDKLVSGGEDRRVIVQDVKSGRVLDRSPPMHKGSVCAVAISPDGKTLVSGCGAETIKFWELDNVSGGASDSHSRHKSAVRTLAFSPDGQTLASGSEDNTVKLWHVATRSETISLPHEDHVRLVMFSPDGSILASVTDRGTLRLFRTPKLKDSSGP